ncbi:hypothetical protein CDAR_440121 [Caerostris darwini]|uniref:Uncharacterized protein n=1 Tax=Caerostris darwini TaxID=1538125 RepID=A0AAV4RLR5_9ARAC|nr:hypothetical protein CDAR_440121 [Caerostris darwini]
MVGERKGGDSGLPNDHFIPGVGMKLRSSAAAGLIRDLERAWERSATGRDIIRNGDPSAENLPNSIIRSAPQAHCALGSNPMPGLTAQLEGVGLVCISSAWGACDDPRYSWSEN